MKRLRVIASLVLTTLFIQVAPAAAQTTADLDRIVLEARQTLRKMMASPDSSIPMELLAKSKAIVIYPSLLKAGFIVGGRYGRGVVLKRDKKTGQWGAMSFSTIVGGSVGLQAGIQASDLVLVIMNNRGLKSLVSTKFELGGDLGVAVGPVGRTTEIGTDIMLRAGILSYSRSRGLYGGATLNGAVVMPDEPANRIFYGRPVTAMQIMEEDIPPPGSAKELAADLNRYSALWSARTEAKKRV